MASTSALDVTVERSSPSGIIAAPTHTADGVIARVRALAAVHGDFGASFDDPEDEPARMLAAIMRAVDHGRSCQRCGWLRLRDEVAICLSAAAVFQGRTLHSAAFQGEGASYLWEVAPLFRVWDAVLQDRPQVPAERGESRPHQDADRHG